MVLPSITSKVSTQFLLKKEEEKKTLIVRVGFF